MLAQTSTWLEGLRDFAAARRAAAPAADAERSPAERTAERAILGGHLVSWLAEFDAWNAARRGFAAAGADPEPAVVLTTSTIGIETAVEICSATTPSGAILRPRLACVTELEYRLWCIRHPDASFRLHVNHWSWLKTNVPSRREAEFARHPRAAAEAYWLHRAGTAGAGVADGRDCHLWKWTGRQAVLLEAFVREGQAAPRG